jgi:hypothetical protein
LTVGRETNPEEKILEYFTHFSMSTYQYDVDQTLHNGCFIAVITCAEFLFDWYRDAGSVGVSNFATANLPHGSRIVLTTE